MPPMPAGATGGGGMRAPSTFDKCEILYEGWSALRLTASQGRWALCWEAVRYLILSSISGLIAE